MANRLGQPVQGSHDVIHLLPDRTMAPDAAAQLRRDAVDCADGVPVPVAHPPLALASSVRQNCSTATWNSCSAGDAVSSAGTSQAATVVTRSIHSSAVPVGSCSATWKRMWMMSVPRAAAPSWPAAELLRSMAARSLFKTCQPSWRRNSTRPLSATTRASSATSTGNLKSSLSEALAR